MLILRIWPAVGLHCTISATPPPTIRNRRILLRFKERKVHLIFTQGTGGPVLGEEK